MTHRYLIEEKELPKLPVIFSSEVMEKVYLIEDCNQDNEDALSQFYDYLDSLQSLIGNHRIACDYMSRYQHKSNGQVHIKELNFDVTYIIDTSTEHNYVFVIDINLVPKTCTWSVPEFERYADNDSYCDRLLELYDLYLHQLFGYV